MAASTVGNDLETGLAGCARDSNAIATANVTTSNDNVVVELVGVPPSKKCEREQEMAAKQSEEGTAEVVDEMEKSNSDSVTSAAAVAAAHVDDSCTIVDGVKKDDEEEEEVVEAQPPTLTSTTTDDGGDVVDGDTETEAETTHQIEQLKQQPEEEEAAEEEKKQHQFVMDDIPEPIKVLDDIISEFDGETTKPAALHNNSGENQSEDDGYMSLSRKNMSKKDSEDVAQTPSTDTVPEGSFTEGDGTAENLAKLDTDTPTPVVEPAEQQLIQTTLPKARAANTTPASISNYSSLPCCGARNNAAANGLNTANASGPGGVLLDAKTRTGSYNGERNALGIDISAVHNAVLRGNLAKLPEPMPNEHPVTIYPGPSTKSGSEGGGARSKRHQLINSVEQHKEVCHMLNPHSTSPSSSSSGSNVTTSSSSGEASPAASNINVAKKSMPPPLSGLTQNAEIYSEDSLEEDEESTISTDITPVKQNGIAWEIHFKNSGNNKKKQTQQQCKSKASSTKSSVAGVKKTHSKVANSTSNSLADYNNVIYNQSNMLGKGTFVIRRSVVKKPPRVIDIFNVPKPSISKQMHQQDVLYTSDSELSESSLPPPPLPATAAAEANFIYKECEASAAATRRSLEMAAQQRAALLPPRERLSLNIESAHQSREANIKSLGHTIASPDEHNTKALKKCSLNLTEKRLSAESMPDNTSSSEEFDEARLNGNGFDLFPYNANGIKPQEYEHRTSASTTPHTDLAPTLEEDEELSDFSYGCAPLKQIENNISALLRGDIPIARATVGGVGVAGVGVIGPTAAAAAANELLLGKRPLEFRPGVHKSESAKEMLLSQNAFGPLPPSPPSSNPDLFDYDAPLPPLPPSPIDHKALTSIVSPSPYLQTNTTVVEVHATASGAVAVISPVPPPSKLDSARRSRDNVSAIRHFNDELPPPPAPTHQSSFEILAPIVPPHRGHSVNSMKSWSIDSNYRKRSPKMLGYSSSNITTPTGPGGCPLPPLPPPPIGATAQSAGSSYESGSYTRRYVNYGTKRSLKQSPREEHRLQTSCSLPETPIFARGCDIPRTPYRRQNEPPAVSGSRTAPRSSTSNSINMGTSIVGIGAGNYGTGQMCRQRSINHALASNEMLRMTGAPARGWYPKQRSMRPVSTENIDRLSAVRVWDNPAGMSGTGQSRKPLTLPPNLTPSFLHKSPREALRRVTSLLITKKKNPKERKHKAYNDHTMDPSDKHYYEFETEPTKQKDNARKSNATTTTTNTNTNTKKKKGLFKTLWKRTKTVSLDQ